MSNTPQENREPITDLLVLSALDRGERHRAHADPGVPIWAILEHVDARKRSKRARQVRTVLEDLVESGAVSQARRHSMLHWAVTRKGAARLRRARRAGKAPVLPESPQHRLWREAQAIAEQEIEGLRQSLAERLERGSRLLCESDPTVRSDTWFVLGDEIERAAWMLGSASYCLREWGEPHDDKSDKDDLCDPGDIEFTSIEMQRLRRVRFGRRKLKLRHEFPDD